MRHRQAGFTLVEVLVAALVLVIGIVAGLASQLAALRTRQHTALMSAAVALAGGAADRIRANNHFRDQYLGFDYDALRDGAPSAFTGCYGGSGCGASALAAFDLHELRQAVHGAFPGGRIVVCRDDAPTSAGRLKWACGGGAQAPVVIKIGWVERGVPGEAVPLVAVLADGGSP